MTLTSMRTCIGTVLIGEPVGVGILLGTAATTAGAILIGVAIGAGMIRGTMEAIGAIMAGLITEAGGVQATLGTADIPALADIVSLVEAFVPAMEAIHLATEVPRVITEEEQATAPSATLAMDAMVRAARGATPLLATVITAPDGGAHSLIIQTTMASMAHAVTLRGQTPIGTEAAHVASEVAAVAALVASEAVAVVTASEEAVDVPAEVAEAISAVEEDNV